MGLTYFLNDFEMVLVAPIITVSPLFLHSTYAVYFYCKVFIFQNLLSFYLNHISVS
jgi:hypothetical protein